MRRIGTVLSCLFILCLGLCLCAQGAAGQVLSTQPVQRGNTATEADVACAGMITPENISYDMYVISGEQADPQTVFSWGQYVYVNKGSEGGVKVGDEFMVLRPLKDPHHVKMYDAEHTLSNSLGTQWGDMGRLRIVVVQPRVSIAQVSYSCTYIQRGDYVLPAVTYPVPALRPLKDLDRFAPPSGKAQGRVVRAKNFQSIQERGAVAYVNVTGVKPGDYIRFFHQPATRNNSVYQIGGMADHVFGFGRTPQHWQSQDLPREVLGEGVVLRVTPTTASVLVYNCLREIYIGDLAEVE